MNWYKKIAQDIEENPRDLGLNYLDFGHDFSIGKLQPYIMWYVDWDWDIHTKKISQKATTHEDWSRQDEVNNIFFNFDTISQGRYDPQTHVATIAYITIALGNSKETQQKVYQLLNMEFNNPRILNFNK